MSLSLNKDLIVSENFVDGKWVEAFNGKTIDVINPTTEEVIAKVPLGEKKT